MYKPFSTAVIHRLKCLNIIHICIYKFHIKHIVKLTLINTNKPLENRANTYTRVFYTPSTHRNFPNHITCKCT